MLADENGVSIKVAKYAGSDKVDLIENEEYGYCSLIKATHQVLEKLKIENNCVWHSRISHEEFQQLKRICYIFYFTSIAEGTPHVILEAFSNNLPVLCFNTCGHGDSVNEQVGIKIPLSTPQQSINDFAEKITYLFNHRDVLKQMSENCRVRQEELSWDNKAKQMVSLYEKVLSQE